MASLEPDRRIEVRLSLKGLLADCRHALRLYRRTPGASVIAVLVLGVGLAFVGAFLSLYVDLILRPHPGFEQSNRLATLGQNGGPQLMGIPMPFVERMADELTSVEAVAASLSTSVLIGQDREQAGAEMVSDQFFDGLRPRLVLGRGFLPEEQAPDAEPVAVISHRLWQARFGGRPDVVGTAIDVHWDPGQPYFKVETVEMGGRTVNMTSASAPERETTSYRIVGVMAPSLRGLAAPETAIWVPVELAFPLYVGGSVMLSATMPKAFVRRQEGVTATAVVRELEARYAGEMSALNPLQGTRLDAIDGVVRDISVQRDARRQLQMFLTGSVLLALVAGTNVSLFLLARAPGRRRELAIRLAVGAPLRRLARQLATEAGLLVVAAAGLGLLASVWLGMFLRGLALLRDAEWRDVTLLDWRVIALAGAFLLVLTLLVSLAPVVGLTRSGIAATSRQVTGRASLAQRLAGTAQLAVAGALGGAAIAFAWYLGALTLRDPGFELADRYVAQFRLPGAYPGADTGVRLIAIPRRREIIESIPGVSAVTFGRPVPGTEQGSFSRLNVPRSDDPSTTIEAMPGYIDGRFIDVVGLRLVFGRALEEDEQAVLVNQSLARAIWGREDVVGERIPAGGSFSDRQSLEVVGVLEDMSFTHPAAAVEPFVFQRSGAFASGSVVIESSLTAAALQQQLDRINQAGEIDVSFGSIQPLSELRRDQLAPDRARSFLTIATAVLVVLLAAFGYYGTQRYLVAAGRREYAIRAALGAGPRALGRLVVARGLLMSLPGLVLGGLLALVFVAWLRDDYLGGDVSPVAVMLAVVAGLALLLVAATLGPAGEARRTQPAPMLRED